ncbi:meiotic nuclear division protein 1 [Dendrothele bispora CBS 962.96]|uniref:Meiotic nuclear division protein 1 n=1 Tax=Dendrothele bispora (strain CBS 962.96) TaxID=1314807 RepID=A0A4S8MQ91_DENBC|nr:meiotic nuclear division protein 1 [Dendrothele bispora CBS 962.96]
MAPRGLSAEEKRVKLMEIFHETKDFYQLKELEKIAPKMKGIVSQSVKEVLQSLVDDGLVQSDKIGSSNFFWSFPSQQGALIQSRLSTVKEQRTANEVQLEEIKNAIDMERSLRVESEHRTKLLSELSELKRELCRLDQELSAYGACDPVKLEETKRAITLGKEAAIRWTDNYSVLLSHFTRQTGVPMEDIRKFLDIKEDYEDIP